MGDRVWLSDPAASLVLRCCSLGELVTVLALLVFLAPGELLGLLLLLSLSLLLLLELESPSRSVPTAGGCVGTQSPVCVLVDLLEEACSGLFVLCVSLLVRVFIALFCPLSFGRTCAPETMRDDAGWPLVASLT